MKTVNINPKFYEGMPSLLARLLCLLGLELCILHINPILVSRRRNHETHNDFRNRI
jgi:hypothetical protein